MWLPRRPEIDIHTFLNSCSCCQNRNLTPCSYVRVVGAAGPMVRSTVKIFEWDIKWRRITASKEKEGMRSKTAWSRDWVYNWRQREWVWKGKQEVEPEKSHFEAPIHRTRCFTIGTWVVLKWWWWELLRCRKKKNQSQLRPCLLHTTCDSRGSSSVQKYLPYAPHRFRVWHLHMFWALAFSPRWLDPDI